MCLEVWVTVFEVKSKSQLREILKALSMRGKFPSRQVDFVVSLADLPESVNMRIGGIRARLGGYKSDYRRGRIRKGETR